MIISNSLNILLVSDDVNIRTRAGVQPQGNRIGSKNELTIVSPFIMWVVATIIYFPGLIDMY